MSGTAVGADLHSVFADLFRRLERDHGPCLVERYVAFIAVSRIGLAEDEIVDLLSFDRDVMAARWRDTRIWPDTSEASRAHISAMASRRTTA